MRCGSTEVSIPSMSSFMSSRPSRGSAARTRRRSSERSSTDTYCWRRVDSSGNHNIKRNDKALCGIATTAIRQHLDARVIWYRPRGRAPVHELVGPRRNKEVKSAVAHPCRRRHYRERRICTSEPGLHLAQSRRVSRVGLDANCAHVAARSHTEIRREHLQVAGSTDEAHAAVALRGVAWATCWLLCDIGYRSGSYNLRICTCDGDRSFGSNIGAISARSRRTPMFVPTSTYAWAHRPLARSALTFATAAFSSLVRTAGLPSSGCVASDVLGPCLGAACGSGLGAYFNERRTAWRASETLAPMPSFASQICHLPNEATVLPQKAVVAQGR